jgi:kinesin family protein C2/C3
VRVRPLLQHEVTRGEVELIKCREDSGELVVNTAQRSATGRGKPAMNAKKFNFDTVFGPRSTQEEVYEQVSPLVCSVLEGYHACIFAYGQTGSGKTFSMDGTSTDQGIIWRAIQELFAVSEKGKIGGGADGADAVRRVTMKATMVEIYNENVRDLLRDTSADGASANNIDVRQGLHGVHLPDAVTTEVDTAAELHLIMQNGLSNRATHATNANEHSSRSHSVLIVSVQTHDLETNTKNVGKLVLCDLAGSERISKTDAQGDRLKEAQNINRSLSALGDVMSALEQKRAHVPFRNSKLTYLLQVCTVPVRELCPHLSIPGHL